MQITVNNTLFYVMECGDCGVQHAFPLTIYETAQREGGFWHCPNGHQRGWRDGAEKEEMAVLRREKERLTQNAAYLESRVADEARRADAEHKKFLQMQRRAISGVCPCCNRTFVNVQRHMASKHKNVVPIAQKTAGMNT